MFAVPRGALLSETLDTLDSLGLDTAEMRENDRKLLFERIGTLRGPAGTNTEIGAITRRPADVPTYVEAGAADLGVTGKDVLLEQVGFDGGAGGREVYELLDLGFGGVKRVVGTQGGGEPAG